MHLFEFHTGLAPKQHGNQFIMDCPFCDKADHFFYNPTNFMWDCKVCMASGNPIMFLRKLYDMFDNTTKAAQMVSAMRDLPLSAIQSCKVKHNDLNGSFLIPTFKHGKLNNLYKATCVRKQDKKTGEWHDKWIIMASPAPMEHTLMNWDETFPDKLWIVEGHWDRMAAAAIVGSQDIGITGVPGAGVWKDSWCEAIADKDIVFCYDNDPSGRAGFENVILKHISKSQYKPKSISVLRWPEDKPEGYDLNDTYREFGRGSFNRISDWIQPYSAPENTVVVKSTVDTVVADKSCQTFEDLVSRYEQVYHTTDPMRLGLLLVLSSIYSVRIEGEQLWIRLIGAPSSGKTTIAKCVSGSEQVVIKSTFTGLFSGWKDDAGQDASLIPLIAGKTLIVKDADALLRQPNIEKIFSELRDFYDKDSSTFFKNMVSFDYKNIRSTMILCGTYALRRSDQSFLGERFLDFELNLSERDRECIEDRMLQRSMMTAVNPSTLPPEMPVVAAAKGFIEALMQKPNSVQLGIREQTNIRVWAKLAATLRTKVDREKFGQREIMSEPVIEVPARLIGQLTKLYMCASVVLGLDKPNDMVHRLVAKVVGDIIDYNSPRLRLCRHMMHDYRSRDELCNLTDLSIERVNRELQDLIALQLVSGIKTSSISGVGAKVLKLKLIDTLREGLEHIGFS